MLTFHFSQWKCVNLFQQDLGIEKSCQYVNLFRNNGWESSELKVYWNAIQVDLLRPKHNQQIENERLPPYESCFVNVVKASRQHSVLTRNHGVKITYVNKVIEKAVFDIPNDVPIILLHFAVSYFRLKIV